MNAKKIGSSAKFKRTARVLGLGGLIPFVSGAATVWTVDQDHRLIALDALISYAALIAAFLGALHWGRTIAGHGREAHGRIWLVWSVVPLLVAWPMMYLPRLFGLILAIGLILLLLAVDRSAARAGLFPSWMFNLRVVLTSVASLSLLLALINILIVPIQGG